jgi:hypothetical protein
MRAKPSSRHHRDNSWHRDCRSCCARTEDGHLMASEKQISANRRNAQKSTGPKTEVGKLRSRQNAYRHGLTAQTVISLVEKAEEYADLESLIIADYEPQTTIERVQVERLASLLWRLRRAVASETGLFEKLNGESSARTISAIDPFRTFRKFLSTKKPVNPKLEYRAPESVVTPCKGADAETVLTRQLGRRSSNSLMSIVKFLNVMSDMKSLYGARWHTQC